MDIQNYYNVGSIFAYYGSITAFLTLAKQSYHQFTPKIIREYIAEKIEDWFSKQKILDNPKLFTLVINYYDYESQHYRNNLYIAIESYLTKKLRSMSTCLEGYRENGKQPVSYQLAQHEEYIEYVALDEDNKDVKLYWKFYCAQSRKDKDNDNDSHTGNKKLFELSFDPRYKDAVLDHFIPLVVVKGYDTMIEMQKEIYLRTYEKTNRNWRSMRFNHPFTFDTLALDPDLKKSIIDDIDRFIRRKEFYKKVGKAWKRGYLLYGPPGTGKSSLIAAIANYLKFSVYDFQLGSIEEDSTLRNLMLSITNKSILVIEDIDCASGLSRNNNNNNNVALSRERGRCEDQDNDSTDSGNCDGESGDDSNDRSPDHNSEGDAKISLSGLLNFIDGLWSSCGDERIIILTTNYKERLDPALLRPGRMDMHIHMSYLKMPGFRVLASNYLDVMEHPLFEEIEGLLEITEVSPAEIAEELIRSEDPDVALNAVINMLKQKKKRGRAKGIKGKEDTMCDEPPAKKQKYKYDNESISDTVIQGSVDLV